MTECFAAAKARAARENGIRFSAEMGPSPQIGASIAKAACGERVRLVIETNAFAHMRLVGRSRGLLNLDSREIRCGTWVTIHNSCTISNHKPRKVGNVLHLSLCPLNITNEKLVNLQGAIHIFHN